MISINLSAVKENEPRSAKLAVAIAAFEARGGHIAAAPGFFGQPVPPPRSGRIDPETILKRRRKMPTATERRLLRELSEAL
jgi:hypothetical protein